LSSIRRISLIPIKRLSRRAKRMGIEGSVGVTFHYWEGLGMFPFEGYIHLFPRKAGLKGARKIFRR